MGRQENDYYSKCIVLFGNRMSTGTYTDSSLVMNSSMSFLSKKPCTHLVKRQRKLDGSEVSDCPPLMIPPMLGRRLALFFTDSTIIQREVNGDELRQIPRQRNIYIYV